MPDQLNFKFIFQTAYKCALNAKRSFAKFTCTALEILAADAPAIGMEKNAFQNKVKVTLSEPVTSHIMVGNASTDQIFKLSSSWYFCVAYGIATSSSLAVLQTGYLSAY